MMSNHPDQQYFAARALEERRMSEAATNPRAIAIHAEMEARYEALACDLPFELPMLCEAPTK
jgi:hypothetical protein